MSTKILFVQYQKSDNDSLSAIRRDAQYSVVGKCSENAAALKMLADAPVDIVAVDCPLENAADALALSEQMGLNYDIPLLLILPDR